MQRVIRMLGGMLVLCLVLGGTGRATTVVPLSVEDLTSTANVIVEARAVQSWTAWNAQRTIIYTYTRFAVDKTLKGRAGTQILVKQPGGVVGEIGQAVPGVRHFMDGEDVALFLRPSFDGDSALSIVGLMQGNFRFLRGNQGEVAVTNGVLGVATLSNGSVRTYHGTTMSLQALETRVQKAVGR